MSDEQYQSEEIAGPCGDEDEEALAEIEAMPKHYGQEEYDEETS